MDDSEDASLDWLVGASEVSCKFSSDSDSELITAAALGLNVLSPVSSSESGSK